MSLCPRKCDRGRLQTNHGRGISSVSICDCVRQANTIAELKATGYHVDLAFPCSHCGRANDFDVASLCRACWLIRNRKGGPEVSTITGEEIARELVGS